MAKMSCVEYTYFLNNLKIICHTKYDLTMHIFTLETFSFLKATNHSLSLLFLKNKFKNMENYHTKLL